VTPVVPDPIEPEKAKFPRWLAVLPAFLLVSIFGGRALMQTGGAAKAITAQDPASTMKTLSCVEVYGISLANSEYYVPEGQQFLPKTTPRISTVLNGMVRNDCGEPLKSITIQISVLDDAGKRGDGYVTVPDLNSSEAKPFDRAWMGRVTQYEIGKIRTAPN
jgi:hypothetical protein